MLVRGAVRPGILVEEAEAPMAQLPSDVFVLRWLAVDVDKELSTSLTALQCEILYATCGTQAFGGLDRGRLLSEMDAELLALLQPFQTPKMSFAVQPPAAMQSGVFWDPPVFTSINIQRDRLSRSAKLLVYSYEEEVKA